AVHPWEKARNTMASATNQVVWCWATMWYGADSATGTLPETPRTRAHPSIAKTIAMNPYVGIANTVPDSLTPRRFMRPRTATRPMHIGTAYGPRDGNAETMFATPAATDTATVST